MSGTVQHWRWHLERFWWRCDRVAQEASTLIFARLLHSPSLVVLGLLVRCKTWPTIGWHHPFVMCWSKYRLGWHQSQWIDHWKFPPFFRGHWQSSCTALTAIIYLLLGLCKETVKGSISLQTGRYSGTMDVWAHKWNLEDIFFALIFIVIIQSDHNFAHDTTAQLSCHVQNYDLFGCLFCNITAIHVFARVQLWAYRPFVQWDAGPGIIQCIS